MCKIQSTILCPIWRLLCKKLLSEGTKRDGYKPRSLRSWSGLYGEHDSELLEGHAKTRGVRKELPTSTEAKELKENTVNNLWSQQQQGLPLIYAEGGHLACVTINLRLDKAGSSEKRFSAFSEAQGRPTANRARIWNHDLNYFTSSKQIQWRPQTSTAGRGSSQQIEGASSQASGQGGVSEPSPTNQFRSVLQKKYPDYYLHVVQW